MLQERPLEELGLFSPPVFVEGSSDGERILVASKEGDVVLLDSALEPVSQWSFSVAVDQFGAADSRSALTWDGGSHVVLPPNNDGINGPIMGWMVRRIRRTVRSRECTTS